VRPKYESPGVYTIHVDGRVNEVWSDRLGGLTIVTIEPDDDSVRPETILKGYLPDQAALLGVLNTLYNNRYPVLFVRYLRPQIDGAPFEPNQDQCRA
jgi:hypothetical protein